MKSRLSQLLILVGAFVAFLPITAVDFLLDGYIRERETEDYYERINSITLEIQRSAYSGVEAIANVLNKSPSLCTPTFIGNVQDEIGKNIYVRQMLVENDDGVQYCNAFEKPIGYSLLSRNLVIPGSDENVAVVRLADETEPMLRITRQLGNSRSLSAFVYLSPRLLYGLPAGMKEVSLLKVELTDGTTILAMGKQPEIADAPTRGELVSARSVADALPIVTEVAIPFETVRARYSELDLAITLAASVVSIGFLIIAFNYIRKARLPGFNLERAIINGELKPYYQPIFDMSTGCVLGCEVLIRWEKPGGKVIPPGVFIDYAEATGLAIPMTLNLMEQVERDLNALCIEVPSLKIGINLFEGHFHDTGIVDDVQTIFAGSSISFDQLVFEITERRPLDKAPATTNVISGLHALGCRIAMDDAGTGHSNLEYIHKLGIDILKIDRVFVSMIGDGEQKVPILDGLINMGDNMGLEIVAEGIETEEQAAYLKKQGVFQAQGFLFAPALRVENFVELAHKLHVGAALEDLENAAAKIVEGESAAA